MEEAAAVRRAALDAVQDVSPPALATRIESIIAEGSFVPGVCTLMSARAVGGERTDGVVEYAAGVQLVYDGLSLTRSLAHDEPWARDPPSDRDADLDILAADVLVARGFYMLARTEAADAAVEVIRTFGRDQTRRERAEDPVAVDHQLEADVLALAVVTGTTAAGGSVPDGHVEFAGDLAARADGGFPAPERLFDDGVADRLARLADPGRAPAADG